MIANALHEKYFKIVIVVCTLSVFLLVGCSNSKMKKPVEFSENTSVTAVLDVADSKINIIQDNIITNSEKLTVTNRTGNHQITVYLFQNDETEAIMSFDLDENEKKEFTNLTSAHIYSIGVSVKNLSEEITVSCEITG